MVYTQTKVVHLLLMEALVEDAAREGAGEPWDVPPIPLTPPRGLWFASKWRCQIRSLRKLRSRIERNETQKYPMQILVANAF